MARRRSLSVVVAFAGIGLLVLAAPLLREQALREVDPQQAETAAPLEKAVVSPTVSQPATLSAPARPVAPQIVAPPPVKHDVLERIDPREPLSQMGRAHVPSEGPAQETLLHRPVVNQAGAFEAMGYHIRLLGLLLVPEDQMCGDGEAAWPCGIHARTAFRNWLRGRALACTVPPTPPAEPVITPCHLGAFDAGSWLVGQGWALADPADDRYATLEKEARSAQRGLHGRGPAVLVPFAVTLPQAINADPALAGERSGD